MKGTHAEVAAKIRQSPVFDMPRVLLAASTATPSSTVVQALRNAGYVVSTTTPGAELVRALRSRDALELLILDLADMPWAVASTIDSVRAINWALPIVLISGPDRALHAEAERLGVETILESPVTAEELRRAAMKIVPVLPEVELDLVG